jgi:hypothetical protein
MEIPILFSIQLGEDGKMPAGCLECRGQLALLSEP